MTAVRRAEVPAEDSGIQDMAGAMPKNAGNRRATEGESRHMYFQDIEEWAAFGAVADALVAHLADQGFVTSPSDLEDLYRDWRLVRGHPAEWYLRRADAREILANDTPPVTGPARSTRADTAFDQGLSRPATPGAPSSSTAP